MSIPAVVCLLAGTLLVAWPARLDAQDHDQQDGYAGGARFGLGGEVQAIAGPQDHSAYFNYTDYDRNALRITRLRLFGEWRPADRFSVVGEVRTENLTLATVPALYARWRPLPTRDLFIQAGRIPPVIGVFSRRAYGRDNVVIGQPLAYQYLTSLRPDAIPASTDDLIRMRGRGWQSSFPIGASALATGMPLVSVSLWDTGVSGTWRLGWGEIAAGVTRGAPAVPVVADSQNGLTWSGRTAVHLPAGVVLGFSAARGQWIADEVLRLVQNGDGRPTSQTVIGTDVELGWGHWLVRGEWLRASFELPLSGTPQADIRLHAWSGFAEARYRPHPRWQVGMRMERQGFGTVQSTLEAGAPIPWDADVDRVEVAVGFRVHRHVDVRGGWQHNWRDGGRVRERGIPALAVLYWF